jgi:hypothetical protein
MANIQETDVDQMDINETIKVNEETIRVINDEALETEIKDYLKKINEDIGFYWWRYYTYCAFWANISVPINLTITILTALTTGQTATGTLINNETSTIFGIVVLVVSIFNTFFRPTQQLNNNEEFKKKWSELGTKFEILYYDKIHNSNELVQQEKKVEELFKEVGTIKRDTTNNYFIDLIFMITKRIIGDDITWINRKTFRKKMRGETTDSDNVFSNI